MFSYPNYSPSQLLREALTKAGVDGLNNTEIHEPTDPRGHPRLRKELTTFYSNILNRTLNTDREILVTMGAMQAIPLRVGNDRWNLNLKISHTQNFEYKNW